jgi:hypothetical protein
MKDGIESTKTRRTRLITFVTMLLIGVGGFYRNYQGDESHRLRATARFALVAAAGLGLMWGFSSLLRRLGRSRPSGVEDPEIDAGPDQLAMAVRQSLLPRERYLRYLVTGDVLLAVVALVLAGRCGAIAAGFGGQGVPVSRGLAAVAAVLALLTAGLLVLLAQGLRRLHIWAFRCELALAGALFLGVVMLAGTMAREFLLLLLPVFLIVWFTSVARTLTTPEARKVIARTPHMDIRTGVGTKIVLALFLLLVVSTIYAAIFPKPE